MLLICVDLYSREVTDFQISVSKEDPIHFYSWKIFQSILYLRIKAFQLWDYLSLKSFQNWIFPIEDSYYVDNSKFKILEKSMKQAGLTRATFKITSRISYKYLRRKNCQFILQPWYEWKFIYWILQSFPFQGYLPLVVDFFSSFCKIQI